MTMKNHPFDIHAIDNWVAHRVLSRHAQVAPDSPFLTLLDGEEAVTQSYGECDQMADRVAAGLQSLGLAKGESVGVMLSNSLEYVNSWLGISRSGCVHVAINTEYQGRFLEHVLNNSEARILICEGAWVERVVALRETLPHLQTLVVVGASQREPAGIKVLSYQALIANNSAPEPVTVDYRETGCIMYTSGTTGPSKGVLMPQAHNYLFGLGMVEHLKLSPEDIYYITMPLFHANGMLMQLYATLILGGHAVIRTRFSASAWARDVAHFGVTVTNTLGVMNEFLLRQEPSALDQAHRLRVMAVAPVSKSLVEALKQRFAIPHIIGVYGMTEVNIPLYTRVGDDKAASCGRVWEAYFELEVVDPVSDEKRPRGEIGEIVVRPRQPYAFMSGYNRMDEKTVEAWRNFWFHTGDAAWMDQQGYLYFVDRIKDCIRRRGENISSYEIESVVQCHPEVAEVAAIAVESGIRGGEDEVKIAVVPKAESLPTPEELIEFCRGQMPDFAIPRYVEFMQQLPKTPTAKVRKSQLREMGITPATWDRMAQG